MLPFLGGGVVGAVALLVVAPILRGRLASWPNWAADWTIVLLTMVLIALVILAATRTAAWRKRRKQGPDGGSQ